MSVKSELGQEFFSLLLGGIFFCLASLQRPMRTNGIPLPCISSRNWFFINYKVFQNFIYPKWEWKKRNFPFYWITTSKKVHSKCMGKYMRGNSLRWRQNCSLNNEFNSLMALFSSDTNLCCTKNITKAIQGKAEQKWIEKYTHKKKSAREIVSRATVALQTTLPLYIERKGYLKKTRGW